MLLSINSYSQWSNTTSSNIYKTNNKGNTGIGTSSPVTKLDIVEENGKIGSYRDVLQITSKVSGAPTVGTGVSLNFNLQQGNNNSLIYSAIRAEESKSTGSINGALTFHTQSWNGSSNLVERLRIDHNGQLGIGTKKPEYKLDVLSEGELGKSHNLIRLISKVNSTPTVGTNVGILFSLQQANNTPISFASIEAGESNSTGSNKGYIIFSTQDWNGTNSLSEKMRINHNGNVGIGTSNPGDFKLAVEGKIGAREIKVQTESWADYVFATDYDLMPLTQVKEYITKFNHLPGIPSEKDIIESKGVELGKMQTLLLEKIEELTLYVIMLEEKLKKLE